MLIVYCMYSVINHSTETSNILKDCHINPSFTSFSDILSKNHILMMALETGSGDLQSQLFSSSGDHEHLYKTSIAHPTYSFVVFFSFCGGARELFFFTCFLHILYQGLKFCYHENCNCQVTIMKRASTVFWKF